MDQKIVFGHRPVWLAGPRFVRRINPYTFPMLGLGWVWLTQEVGHVATRDCKIMNLRRTKRLSKVRMQINLFSTQHNILATL
jgi:hypothetical protein